MVTTKSVLRIVGNIRAGRPPEPRSALHDDILDRVADTSMNRTVNTKSTMAADAGERGDFATPPSRENQEDDNALAEDAYSSALVTRSATWAWPFAFQWPSTS